MDWDAFKFGAEPVRSSVKRKKIVPSPEPKKKQKTSPNFAQLPLSERKEIWLRLKTWHLTNKSSVDTYHHFLLDKGDKNPWVGVVSCLLSVQTRDIVAMKATDIFEEKFPSLDVTVHAPIEDIEDCVRICNYHKTKAKYIRNCAQKILEEFEGIIPDTCEELMSIPGIGPKIAYLILTVVFKQKQAGLVVDTHVRRLSKIMGLFDGNSEQVRKSLETWVSKEDFEEFPLALISLGQLICKSRKPNCSECPVKDLCPSSKWKEAELI